MIRCRVTVTTPTRTFAYVGLFPSTTRAAFDAIRLHGTPHAKARAERA